MDVQTQIVFRPLGHLVANHCQRVWRGHRDSGGFAWIQDGFGTATGGFANAQCAAKDRFFKKDMLIPSQELFHHAKTSFHYVSGRTLREGTWEHQKRNLKTATEITGAVTIFYKSNYNLLKPDQDLSRVHKAAVPCGPLSDGKAISVKLSKYHPIARTPSRLQQPTKGSIRGRKEHAQKHRSSRRLWTPRFRVE